MFHISTQPWLLCWTSDHRSGLVTHFVHIQKWFSFKNSSLIQHICKWRLEPELCVRSYHFETPWLTLSNHGRSFSQSMTNPIFVRYSQSLTLTGILWLELRRMSIFSGQNAYHAEKSHWLWISWCQMHSLFCPSCNFSRWKKKIFHTILVIIACELWEWSNDETSV